MDHPQPIPPSLSWAHPLVRDWFVQRFGTPTEPQEQGWPHILSGKPTLISAPTGSGKTLAAFLICIDRLVRKALSGQLQDRTEVLYVSPLKALSNDIQKNLEAPLGEIFQLAGQRGLLMPEIRTAVRTGDTLAHERRAMLTRPPHILVTTPESLYILLTAQKSREVLRTVETVIVDEIHAVADDKRGAHLALSLERLDRLARKRPARIGLSATQKPIELIAQFLTGQTCPANTENLFESNQLAAEIVHIGHRRALDLAVEVPGSELSAVASNEMWGEIYDRLADLAKQHSSTLIFVNTRRLAERVAHHLGERLGVDAVAAHHGSLSRKLRLAAEKKLKEGQIRALVATASLELGIDIGSVDLVCQIGSPRAISVGLQRIGRAGHWRGAIPKGRIFATTRDELLECAALVRSIRQGDLDRIQIPEAPLDILAQQIVAMCAAEDWNEADLYRTVCRAYPYRHLPLADFDAVVEMLSEGIAGSRARYAAYLHRDRVNGVLRARRGSRLAAITSGGAIPENALYTVIVHPDGTTVGTLDEDFAVESLAGDIILLGNSSWRIRRVQSGSVLVEDAHGAAPSIPFWLGEAPGRSDELSAQVSDLRHQIDAFFPLDSPAAVDGRFDTDVTEGKASNNTNKSSEHCHPEPVRPILANGVRDLLFSSPAGAAPFDFKGAGFSSPPPVGAPPSGFEGGSFFSPSSSTIVDAHPALSWLQSECGLDQSAAEQLISYILAGRAVLRAVPTQHTIVAERFFDESGGMQLVIHAPFGARINKAWGLALRKRFCRSFNFELQAAATDNGLNISLAEQHSFPLADVFHFLHPNSVKEVLEQAVLTSPLFTTRWRWDAGRALALLRFRGGKKVPPQIQRMKADDLLASVFPEAQACQENISGDIVIPTHPLIREVMKDVLTEAMDFDGLLRVLHAIADGNIQCIAVDTPVPSQFSHEILNANPYAYLDDAPLEERRARAVEMRRILPAAVVSEVGRLDPAAIAEVRADAWPDVRDAEELHDALLTLIALPLPSEVVGAAFLGGPLLSALQKKLRESIPHWASFYEQLASAHRVQLAHIDGLAYWVASERAKSFLQIFPAAYFDASVPDIAAPHTSREDAVTDLITGWMAHSGPVTAGDFHNTLALSASDIEKALLRLEASGLILRGQFTNSAATGTAAETEWCDRRLLARIHRLTLGKLRKQVEAVTAAQFMHWLLHWQHAAPSTTLLGERGTLEALRQLQGFEAPANTWERQILARRVADYDPEVLDQLCLTGAVGWGRLSPHPATLQIATTERRRVIPTSVAPITFFVRDDAEWMISRREPGEEETRALSPDAKETLRYLRQYGASFFADIVRGTGKLKSEVETALWELVAAGLLTADGFDNLRALIDPKRRSGHGNGRTTRPRHSAGRWSLLYSRESVEHTRVIEATCWMLLHRYGIVFREILARESILPRWRELLLAFRRLEDRGEVRGGRFVHGFIGEQFALPVAVESLRAQRNAQPSSELITIAAADPLNLVGIVVPGERVPANSGKLIAFRAGIALPPSERDSLLVLPAAR